MVFREINWQQFEDKAKRSDESTACIGTSLRTI